TRRRDPPRASAVAGVRTGLLRGVHPRPGRKQPRTQVPSLNGTANALDATHHAGKTLTAQLTQTRRRNTHHDHHQHHRLGQLTCVWVECDGPDCDRDRGWPDEARSISTPSPLPWATCSAITAWAGSSCPMGGCCVALLRGGRLPGHRAPDVQLELVSPPQRPRSSGDTARTAGERTRNASPKWPPVDAARAVRKPPCARDAAHE